MKSTTCFSNKNNQPLTVYLSEYDAQKGADYVNNTHNNNLSPYQCSKCGDFHLSPQDRQTPSSKCGVCTGSDGRQKDLYPTEQIAKKRASILYKERGIYLNTYICPSHNGWHLTKQAI